MATNFRNLPVTDIQELSDTNEMFTFGTVNATTDFSASNVYEIGDLVRHTDAETGLLSSYRFIAHHSAGDWNSDHVQALTGDLLATYAPTSVKADLTFVTRDTASLSADIVEPPEFDAASSYSIGDTVTHNDSYFNFISSHMGAWSDADVLETPYILSLCDYQNYVEYEIHVVGEDGTTDNFHVGGILVTATTPDGKRTVKRRTNSEGIAKLYLLKAEEWFISCEDIDGYDALGPSGKIFYLTPQIINTNRNQPWDYDGTWASTSGYHIGERVTYDTKAWEFTAAHSTSAWNPVHVKEVELLERKATFKYIKRKNSDETVSLTVRAQHKGGIPYKNFGPISVFTSDMSYWMSGSANASGDFTIDFPKNSDCQITSVTANWTADFYLPPLVTTVADRNKTVNLTYDSGLYWVVASSDWSIADGTAYKEYLFEDFPFDDPDDEEAWETKTFYNQTTRKYETAKMPIKHPCQLLHVATPELVARKFDHTSMSLCEPNPLVSTSSCQVFPQKDQKYDASYYVRLEDLSTQRSAEVVQGRQWCSQNLLHEHVTTSRDAAVLSSYDGPLMTSWCKYDSENRLTNDSGATFVAASSQAANYALSSEFSLGDRTLHGFIGTYMQMNPLFMLSDAIYSGMEKFGYVGNYKTGTYWWSVTQYSPTQAMDRWYDYWHSYWTKDAKTYAAVKLLFLMI